MGRPLYVFLQVQDVTLERAAMEEVRQSEERFRLLVEVVQDYAIFMLDPHGLVSSGSCCRADQGLHGDEIIGQHFRGFYPPELQAAATLSTSWSWRSPRTLRGRGMADSQGRYSVLGQRRHHCGERDGEHIGFAKVTRDNSERRRLEEEREDTARALAQANTQLASLNERLRAAADEQAQFLAVTAHELRTPVGVLAGSADLVGRHWEQMTEQERAEQLDAMHTSTSRLRRLLADLLTASRLEGKALELNVADVPVAEIVNDAVETVRRANEGADIVVDPLPTVVVRADGDRLSQAVDNLLINALKHGEPPVRIGARVSDHRIEIRVSDTGTGVAEGMQLRLFDRFATGRSRGGTGLGLFIVRELARAQGGDAYYEPPTSDVPSGTFVMILPIEPVPAAVP